MNRGNGRFVLCASLALLIGCGARTSTLEDELGGQSAGSAAGDGGSSAGAGGVHFAGAAPIGGSGVSGSSPAGGAPSAGAPAGGFGAGGFAGTPAGGTAGSFGGFAGFAGFGAIGGDAGTGGVSQLCSVLGSDSCAECQCQTCAPDIEACFSDVGCALIFLCAQQTGCTGVSCYSPKTCQSVIDQSGGLVGKSMGRVLRLGTCAITSQAKCGCN